MKMPNIKTSMDMHSHLEKIMTMAAKWYWISSKFSIKMNYK